MMRRFIAFLTCLLLCAALFLPVSAAQFPDVTDLRTASAADVLQMMGVISGFPDGTFRPQGNLTRAEFCKMSVHALSAQDELALYRAVTVFPDVTAAHWAREYVNFCAKGKSIISGFPDGTFRPQESISAAQAITILLRMLGYEDEVIGGVWPAAYTEKAAELGLLDGTGITLDAVSRPLTRQQAALLFVRLLQTETAAGGTLYTLSEETSLTAVNGGSGTVTVADGKTYLLRTATDNTALLGRRGKLVLGADGKVLTFLPSTLADETLSGTAVVVSATGSLTGFDLLSGGKPYRLYKNGLPATAADLRAQDTAIYREDTGSVLVSDAHLTVIYEACAPSQEQPAILTALGGVQFQVLPSAMQSLARCELGSEITLLLTADGQVAGIADPQSTLSGNTLGFVKDGRLSLCIGSSLVPLDGAAADLGGKEGRVVRINAGQKGKVTLTEPTGNVRGDLDPKAGKLGGLTIAQNALLLDYGDRLSLSSVTETVSARSLTFYRTNWRGEVDLLVLHNGNAPQYGKVTDVATGYVRSFTLNTPTGIRTYTSQNGFSEGDFVRCVPGESGTSVVTRLREFADVPSASWLNDRLVTLDGTVYTVSDNLGCYNAESRTWISLRQARSLYGTMNIYTDGTTVFCIEVGTSD